MHPIVEASNPICCVYMVRIGSTKFYIGATKDLYGRIQSHVSRLNKGYIGSHYMPQLRKDGMIVRFEVLETVDNVERLGEREMHYLDKFRDDVRCINRDCKRPYKARKKDIKDQLQEILNSL
jgi:hypothetical protein